MTTSASSNPIMPGGEVVAHGAAIPHGEAIPRDEAIPGNKAILHGEATSRNEAAPGNEAIPYDEAASRDKAMPDSSGMRSGQANDRPVRMPEPQPDHSPEANPEAATPSLMLPPGASTPPPPDKAFVRRHPAHFIAFGGGVGLSKVAPGTAGTLAALPLFWVLNYFLDAAGFLQLIGIMFVIGIWACAVTGKALGSHDHGGMVWDEITAFLLVLVFTPNVLLWQAFAFLLFRVFDIIKPPPIRYYDSKLRGGFGVMFDDLLAAFYALLCLAAWKAFGT